MKLISLKSFRSTQMFPGKMGMDAGNGMKWLLASIPDCKQRRENANIHSFHCSSRAHYTSIRMKRSKRRWASKESKGKCSQAYILSVLRTLFTPPTIFFVCSSAFHKSIYNIPFTFSRFVCVFIWLSSFFLLKGLQEE